MVVPPKKITENFDLFSINPIIPRKRKGKTKAFINLASGTERYII